MKYYPILLILLLFFQLSAAFALPKILHGNISNSSIFPSDSTTKNSGKLTNLGPQITLATIQGSAFLKDKEGRELLYTVVRGKPAHLIGYELSQNKLILDLPLDNMDGAWGVAVASDGAFYMGGGGGHLYRYIPGNSKTEDLGRPLGTETYIWDIVPGKDSEVFIATYPGCRVVRYHPKDGFSDVGRGAMVANENYVRSLAYNEKTGKIYAGIASHAHLVELDVKTGTKKELLPDKYHKQEAVYYLQLIKDLKGGDRLLATVTHVGKTLIYNLKTGKLEQEIDAIDIQRSIKSPGNDKLYYGSKGDYYAWDFTKSGQVPEKIAKGSTIVASKWKSKDELYIFNKSCQLIKVNTKTGESSKTNFDVPPQPISINTTKLGADGRIWTSGYLTGNNAAYDPAIGKSEPYRGLAQTEGLTLQGTDMYFGIYPNGRLYVYNTLQPWNPAKDNPKLLGKIPDQSRFFAGVNVTDQQKMFFGSVPEYGILGGALVEYNIQTKQLETFTEVVPKHSIVSLAYANGTVIGGTSVWGGLGIKPAMPEAKLFGWNPQDKKKVFEIVPVPDAKAITSLLKGPDGNIWGVADGVLFIFNPATQQVISRHELYKVSEEAKKNHVWKAVDLLIHPSGQIYGTGNGQLFRIDPKTKAVTTVLKPASHLSMDKQGWLYFSRGSDLWQYKP